MSKIVIPSEWAQTKAREWLAQQVELDPIWLDTTTDGVQSISSLATLLDSMRGEAMSHALIEAQDRDRIRDGTLADQADYIRLLEIRIAELEAEVERLKNSLALTIGRYHELEARIAELEASMVRHFQEEHLAGDGPEVDRWKRRVAELEAKLAEAKQQTQDMILERDQLLDEKKELEAEMEQLGER
jgi:DNA repair exonuclease SbcCD ATPase subunit